MKNNGLLAKRLSKKSKGETLAEVVTALAAFGVLLSGLMDFMSTQLQFIARTKHRDELMFKAQILSNYNVFEKLGNDDIKAENFGSDSDIEKLESKASFDWDADKKIITLKNSNSNASLNFSIP